MTLPALWYILDDHNNPVESDYETASRWLEGNSSRREIALTELVDPQSGVEIMVSTVFLVVNHNHRGGAPILFETMIFGGELDEYQMRYATVQEAMWGHETAVVEVMRQHNITLDELDPPPKLPALPKPEVLMIEKSPTPPPVEPCSTEWDDLLQRWKPC